VLVNVSDRFVFQATRDVLSADIRRLVDSSMDSLGFGWP